jgi:hypothetical protein
MTPLYPHSSNLGGCSTPSRGLLHDVRKFEKPKTFGLADKKTLMKAN